MFTEQKLGVDIRSLHLISFRTSCQPNVWLEARGKVTRLIPFQYNQHMHTMVLHFVFSCDK